MRLIDADELISGCKRMIQDSWNSGTAPASWAEAYATFIDDIEVQDTIPAAQWIRVEERLPGWSGDYICVSRDKNGREWVIPAEWSREMKTWFGRFGEIRNKVTHWMPLPEPPEEDVQ